MKSEPDTYSIDDLKRDGFSAWEGVRNYQARNFMRDDMRNGDLALFYHSNTNPPGIAGICRVCHESFPDKTAFDPKSEYYDPKSTKDNPRWMMVEVEFVEKFPEIISIQTLRNTKGLEHMAVLKKGSRLSITPLKKEEFEIIRKMAKELS
jgi:predicted RNA-binding protein with PUA-like domain